MTKSLLWLQTFLKALPTYVRTLEPGGNRKIPLTKSLIPHPWVVQMDYSKQDSTVYLKAPLASVDRLLKNNTMQ